MDYVLSADQSLVSLLENEARWALREGHVSGAKPANYLDLLYLPPLSKASPSAVSIVK
jgi:hypothetical protein